jgi:hypothetical protein
MDAHLEINRTVFRAIEGGRIKHGYLPVTHTLNAHTTIASKMTVLVMLILDLSLISPVDYCRKGLETLEK